MKNISTFMMNLHTSLLKEREITEQTAGNILRTLYSLNGNKSFSNLAFLKNLESVLLRLGDYAPSTQKTMLGQVVSALSLFKEKNAYKKSYTQYYNEMMARKEESKSIDTSKKNGKQEENWLSWNVVKGHEARLREDVEQLLLQSLPLTPNQWETMLSYIVLALYTEFPPRRNADYQLMYVAKTPAQTKDTTKNYFVKKTKQFIFNVYKTSKTHGQQVYDVPELLVNALEVYFYKHPLKQSKTAFPLLVASNGESLKAVNAITRILNRIFGKRVGATMLRHIYLSDKYDVSEMNEDAEKMGHSTALQHEYMKAGGEQEVIIPTLPPQT